MSEIILNSNDALDLVLAHAATLLSTARNTETLPLLESLGRTLAAPVLADRDQPPFARATRDGYALRASDAANALRIVGCVRAGERWTGAPLAVDTAIQIMTGAPLPEGADCVVMVEYVVASDGTLRLAPSRTIRIGEHVVPPAAEARAGDALVPAGRLISAAEIALAAACGYASLSVFSRPEVAILATGDELVEVGAQPLPWQIRNSNTHALAALVRAESAEPRELPIARDTRDDIRRGIEAGRSSSMLLLSGGVSMGDYDFVEEVLTSLGAEFFFTGVLIQPGKPVVFGRLPATAAHQETYFFGLPGNPVSTQVTFTLFVAPLLRALTGRTDMAPRFAEATLAEAIKPNLTLTRFLPAELRGDVDAATVRVVAWQGSGDLAANARANCYAVFPACADERNAGSPVRVLLR